MHLSRLSVVERWDEADSNEPSINMQTTFLHQLPPHQLKETELVTLVTRADRTRRLPKGRIVRQVGPWNSKVYISLTKYVRFFVFALCTVCTNHLSHTTNKVQVCLSKGFYSVGFTSSSRRPGLLKRGFCHYLRKITYCHQPALHFESASDRSHIYFTDLLGFEVSMPFQSLLPSQKGASQYI